MFYDFSIYFYMRLLYVLFKCSVEFHFPFARLAVGRNIPFIFGHWVLFARSDIQKHEAKENYKIKKIVN